MSETNAVYTDLVPTTLAELIAKAEREKLWLHCVYQDLWFSPQELRAENAAGKFQWGVQNWTLRDPKEYVEEARGRVRDAQHHFDRICERVSK